MENVLSYLVEEINSPEVNLPGAVFKLFLSMLLGVLVGLERKRKGQIAGAWRCSSPSMSPRSIPASRTATPDESRPR